MTEMTELLRRVNRVPGVRGSLLAAVEDGLMVDADLMIGVPGEALAALVASLFRRARRSVGSARLGELQFLQVEAEDGLVFAIAAEQMEDLLLVVTAEKWVNIGLVRLEAARVLEGLA
jgi:predicted regulator of Ras-like GTPase activity (Roadblock/LC7/MglB family)